VGEIEHIVQRLIVVHGCVGQRISLCTFASPITPASGRPPRKRCTTVRAVANFRRSLLHLGAELLYSKKYCSSVDLVF
jgi:hypothetical protein